MEQMSGVIEAVARSGTSFKLEGDPGWFGVFRASQMNGAQKGDSVSFSFEAVNKGGKEFLNVKGNVDIDGGGARSAPPARRAAAPSRDTGSRVSSSTAPKDDPRQRSIVRQNSLTQANALFSTLARIGALGEGPASELAVEIIEVARLFEAYSMVEED